MRIRGALILKGGPEYPDLRKAKAWGIDTLLWEADDPALSATLLAQIRAALVDGAKPIRRTGVMRDPSWTGLAAAELGTTMSTDLANLGIGGDPTQPAMGDVETHDISYVKAWLRRFRQLRAKRELYWTLESFQGGLFDQELLDLVNEDEHLHLVRQNYLGTPRMYPVAADQSLADLEDHHLLREKARLAFYDAEQPIPYGWAGFIYNFAALPATPPTSV